MVVWRLNPGFKGFSPLAVRGCSLSCACLHQLCLYFSSCSRVNAEELRALSNASTGVANSAEYFSARGTTLMVLACPGGDVRACSSVRQSSGPGRSVSRRPPLNALQAQPPRQGLAAAAQAPSSRHSHAGAVRSSTYVDMSASLHLSPMAQEEPVLRTRHLAMEGCVLAPRRPHPGIPC